MTMLDYYASQSALGWANSAAQQKYYDALASGQSGDLALKQAQFEWQKKLDEAQQTGQWNNQWNNPQQQWFTSQFGQWLGAGGEPQVGQQTLQGQQQGWQQAFDTSQLYGQYYAPGSAPAAGTQTQAAQSEAARQAAQWAEQFGQMYAPGTAPGAGTTTLAQQAQQFGQGLQTQQEQRAAQAQGQAQAQQYLQLLSSLRGPADWAKYQQVLGSTPGGMRDLVGAAMGQYVPGGGATTGYQPQAASLQSLMGDVTGNPYYGQGGGQLGTPSVYQYSPGMYGQQAPGQAQTMQWQPPQNYPQQQAGMQNEYYQQSGAPQLTPGQNNEQWGSGIGVGQRQATPQQQQQGLGNGTNLPAPNQISAQGWNNMAPSQQQMLLGMYEAQGWDKNDVTALYNQQLPKYGAQNNQAGMWKM
jgi:hypothetical protein